MRAKGRGSRASEEMKKMAAVVIVEKSVEIFESFVKMKWVLGIYTVTTLLVLLNCPERALKTGTCRMGTVLNIRDTLVDKAC